MRSGAQGGEVGVGVLFYVPAENHLVLRLRAGWQPLLRARVIHHNVLVRGH